MVLSVRDFPEFNQKMLRVAALSGAAAVAMGAYGNHKVRNASENKVHWEDFQTANKYHMNHSIMLAFAACITKCALPSKLFLAGIVSFCLPKYHETITQKTTKFHEKSCPIGGSLLMLGWVSVAMLGLGCWKVKKCM